MHKTIHMPASEGNFGKEISIRITPYGVKFQSEPTNTEPTYGVGVANVNMDKEAAVDVADAIYELLGVTPPVSPLKERPHGPQEYKGNGKHSLEHVSAGVTRLRVPGGWLYSKIGSTTFVPMPVTVGYAI